MKKQILFIGIGQLGCTVADLFSRRMRGEGFSASVLAVDTDERTLENVTDAKRISLLDYCRLGEVLDTMDAEAVKKWFPADRERDGVEFFECLSMHTGAGFWRMKAMLSFASFLSKEESRDMLHAELEAVVATASEGDEGEERRVQIYTVASLAGGTGSGLFIPFTLYVKKYLAERGIQTDSVALTVLPDVCEDLLTAEQRVKAEANAYAALRELNAMTRACGTDAAPIRIGGEEDPYFGLLFDSSTDGKPFDKVRIFRRIPGVRVITLFAEQLADTAVVLCTEESDTNRNETDAIYGGVSLLRTVYSAESIEKYIVLRTLSEKVGEEWGRLYDIAEREALRMRKEDAERSKEGEISADLYVRAVLSAVGLLNGNGESDATLLGRTFEDPHDDFTPAMRVPDGLADQVKEMIDAEFLDENLETVEKFLTESEKRSREWKRDRANMTFRSGQRRAQLLKDAQTCGEAVRAFYRSAFGKLTGEEDAFRKRIGQLLDLNAPEGDMPRVGEQLLRVNGEYVHPVLALVRLCSFYRAVEELVTPKTARQAIFARMLSGKTVPDAMLAADAEVGMDCRYSDGGSERFLNAIDGVKASVGGARNDERLFAYDLEIVLNRLCSSFRFARGAVLLEELGKRILSYRTFLTELILEGKELAIEVATARSSYTGDNGTTFFVGGSTAQKDAAYKEYHTYLKRKGMASPYLCRQDGGLGKSAYTVIFENSEADSYGIGSTIADALALLKAQCTESGFFDAALDRNVIDVLLSEEDVGLALRKSFLARIRPLLYRIPDGPDVHLLHRAVSTNTVLTVPVEAEAYASEHPDAFEKAQGARAMEKLLFRAGEYEGKVRFSGTLQKSQLTVCREISGLRLDYLEILSESSADSGYYKSYRKALAMCDSQATELWNPHLVRGFAEALPYIDPDYRD